MKKIIIFTLIGVLMFPAVVPCYANDAITEEDAKTIIQKAVEFNLLIHWKSHVYTSNSDVIDIERSFYHYKGNLLGEHQLTLNIKYYLIENESKLPGGLYEGLPEYARTIFVDDIADDMYNTSRSSYYSGDIPMFHVSDDGKIYIVSDAVAPEYVTFLDRRYEDVVDVIYSDAQKATVRYLINVGFDRDNPMWIECNMVKTDAGWRIAKSPFTDMLRHEWDASEVWEPYVIPYTESPSTADPAFDSFVILSAVSLTCLVPAACLTFKRRRKIAN